jgi:hypothetical protein
MILFLSILVTNSCAFISFAPPDDRLYHYRLERQHGTNWFGVDHVEPLDTEQRVTLSECLPTRRPVVIYRVLAFPLR